MKKLNLIIIAVSTLLVGWQLLRPGYISMHDDLQVMRLYQMRRCLNDGQIPCRWAPDMGFGYGQPMFNYYSAFPYYLGAIFNLFGLPLIDTVKLLFLLSIFISGFFTYLLSRYFLSSAASLLAAVAFMTAPYHALDIFVRGALAEAWGMALLPVVLYFLVRLKRQSTKGTIILSALTLAAFFSSHNLTVIISLFLLAPFLIYLFFSTDKKSEFIKNNLKVLLLGLGLSAFYLLPLLFERSLIDQQYLFKDYYNFRDHFVAVKQFFIKSNWGYGPSRLGPEDGLSFYIGLLPIVSLILTPLAAVKLYKKKNYSGLILLMIFFFLTFLSLFLSHSRSILIWESLPFLAMLQFPWRFLIITALSSSLVISIVFDSLVKPLLLSFRPNPASRRGEWRNPSESRSNSQACLPAGRDPSTDARDDKVIVWSTTILLISILVILNFPQFRFEKSYPNETDSSKLSGQSFITQSGSALLDYIPLSVSKVPTKPSPKLPQTLEGIVEYNYFDNRSNYFSTEVDVRSEAAVISFPISYFPRWTLYHNRSPQPMDFTFNNELGLITVSLEKGHHLIQAWMENTPVRTIANFISLATLGFIYLYLSADTKVRNLNKNNGQKE